MKAGFCLAVPADHDVVQHRQRWEQRQVLECPANAHGRDVIRLFA